MAGRLLVQFTIRKVQPQQCVIAITKLVLVQQCGWKYFRYIGRFYFFKKALGELCERPVSYTPDPQLFCSRVYGLPARYVGVIVPWFYFGMRNIIIPAIAGYLAEYNISFALLYVFFHPVATRKPYQLNAGCVVIQSSHQSFFSPIAFFANIDNDTCELSILGLCVDIGYFSDLGAVEITVGVMIQEAFKGGDSQLLPE